MLCQVISIQPEGFCYVNKTVWAQVVRFRHMQLYMIPAHICCKCYQKDQKGEKNVP